MNINMSRPHALTDTHARQQVKATGTYDAAKQTYTLELEQSCKPTPGQATKEPFHIPVRVGLLGSNGKDLIPERVLELRENKQTFTMDGVKEKPVLSILRGFSAPVKIVFEQVFMVFIDDVCIMYVYDVNMCVYTPLL
jgi:aminopeptidase N